MVSLSQRHVVAQQWDFEMPSHLSFQKFPELERARVKYSHCDCMYALACLWEGRHSAFHIPESKNLTQVTRTQLRRCLLFSSLWHYRGQHRSDGVNNRQISLHFAAACLLDTPLALLSWSVVSNAAPPFQLLDGGRSDRGGYPPLTA